MVFEIFIEQMKDLMNVKLFLEKNMLWWAAYNCNNSSKNFPGKTFCIPQKSQCTRKAWVAALNLKKGTSVQIQHTNVKSILPRALF